MSSGTKCGKCGEEESFQLTTEKIDGVPHPIIVRILRCGACRTAFGVMDAEDLSTLKARLSAIEDLLRKIDHAIK
jgi:hypothetical protein